jgi:hypothetical protein
MRRWIVGALLICILTPAAPAVVVQAATVRNVNASSGTDAGDCHSTLCRTIGYAVSQSASGDTIFLAGASGGMTYAEHDITVNISVTISGPNGTPNTAIINAGHAGRIFDVNMGASLTLSYVNLQNGGFDGFASGGCVRSVGALTFDHVNVMGCTGSEGGGIGLRTGGTLSLTNGTVSGNTATVHGGGIDNTGGTLYLNGVTVSGNHATGNFGYGGGIYNAGTILAYVLSTTVRGNDASGSGGGLVNYGAMTVSLSTVGGANAGDGNTAGQNGGGIWNYGTLSVSSLRRIRGNIAAAAGGGIFNTPTGMLTLDGSTLSGNTATGTMTNSGGGGLYNDGIHGGQQGSATITGTTISGNIAGAGIGSGGGGGIYSAGNLSVTDTTISNNTTAYTGGGIWARDGVFSLVNSIISGNTAPYSEGGGIENDATATITGSTIANNTSAAVGGGISHTGYDLTLTNSTVSGNAAGGIRFNGAMTITGSTISGNTGGGIFPDGTLNLTTSTVSGNATAGINKIFGDAGTYTIAYSTIADNPIGINNPHNVGAFLLTGTVVSALGISGGTACVGPMTSQGHNLDSDNTCGLTQSTDRPASNPLLQALAVNAPGATATHALLPGSPAIDHGGTSTNGCPATDQRGVARPQPSGGQCDIGGYEYQPVAPTGGGVSPDGGGTGGANAITVSGAGFQTGTAVTFGGAPASVTSVNAGGTQLTITTPPHAAGAVDVVVTNPNGQNLTLHGAFTYVAPSGVSPAARGGGSGGGNVTLPPPRGSGGGSTTGAPDAMPPPRP